MGKLDGSCLCGAVTYRCEAEPLATVVCHCTECQRQTGASFSLNVAVLRDAFEARGDSLAEYTTVGTDTGKKVARRFCRECGSPIVSLSEALPEVALIKAGTLDDTSWLEPTLHVWCDSAQSWVPLEGPAQAMLPRGVPA
jgi:hypothetical protein